MYGIRRLAWICAFSVLVCLSALAQETPHDSTQSLADTLIVLPPPLRRPVSPVTDGRNLEQTLSQRPTIALFKSMALPGWGQVGNRQYLKAALFAGLDAMFIYAAVKNGRDANDIRRRFNASTDVNQRNILHDSYELEGDKRNLYTWLAVITTVASMVDAYVDAHLSGHPEHGVPQRVAWEGIGTDGKTIYSRIVVRF